MKDFENGDYTFIREKKSLLITENPAFPKSELSLYSVRPNSLLTPRHFLSSAFIKHCHKLSVQVLHSEENPHPTLSPLLGFLKLGNTGILPVPIEVLPIPIKISLSDIVFFNKIITRYHTQF